MVADVSRRILLSLFAVAAVASAPHASADDRVPTDRLLPSNVLVYFNTPSVTRLQEQFSRTSFGDLVQDPAMAEVRAFVMEKFEEASREAEEDIGMPLSDLLSIPSGEAALAVLQPPGQKIGVVVFLDIGEHQDLLDKLLTKAETEIENNGQVTRTTEEFEGTEIVVYSNPEAQDEPFNAFSYFVKDSMLVGASSVDLLEATLVRWDGQHDQVFAEDATYSYIYDRCTGDGGNPVMTWFLNPLGLVRAGMSAAGPEAGMQAAMVMGFLPVLGVDGLKGMGGVLELATNEYDAVSRSVIYADQPLRGVMRVFRAPAVKQTPPAFVPANVASVSGINWDVEGAYAAVEETWDFFTAPGTFAKIMDDAAESPEGPGLHPKEDIVDLLTGQIIMLQDFPRGESLEQQRMMFAFGVKDPSRMQEVISKITSLEGVNTRVRDFQGTKIYEPEAPGAAQVSPGMAVSGDYLMLAAHVELLEAALRGGDDTLAQSKDFQRVAAEFPAEVSTWSFQRQGQVFEALYGLIQQGASQQQDFDASMLPEWEQIEKYFGLAGSYTIPDEKGVFMESFTLKREE